MSNQMIQTFHVVGISVRTINENGQAMKDIEALWGRFWGEGIEKQIPNKVNDDIYAVYTDYVTDHTGPYTTIIGVLVNSLADIPDGFVGVTIEADHYKKYVSKGKMPEAVVHTWMEIWEDEKLDRSYKADFTVHGEKYHNGNEAEVETFISVQE
ncbi:AraC family transcriptional regulator [Fulvitalea axinellae]|uniref:AraC family transcriptional regulator n=1 Tax=Fulvitalea axinellae TaxID=1182444 RepID=A0AAU9CK94_9BACT|nr:AraC family transcriptional regulator [Fulvitalea axinellae]